MQYIKIIAKTIFCIILIYYFRKFSVDIGTILSKRLLSHSDDTPIEIRQQHRVFLEIVVHIIMLFGAVIIYKAASKFFVIPPVFLLMVLLSPLLFEISGLIDDKTCLKPWRFPHKLLWYLPMRFAVFTVSGFIVYWMREKFRDKQDYAIILVAFIVYHFIKLY